MTVHVNRDTAPALSLRERLQRVWKAWSKIPAEDPRAVAVLDRLSDETQALRDASHLWVTRKMPKVDQKDGRVDTANWLSYCLEVHFAAGFLRNEVRLAPEPRCEASNASNVDFAYEGQDGLRCNFELLRVSEAENIWAEQELKPGVTLFEGSWDGDDEAAQIRRLQRKLREKTIRKGAPYKMPAPGPGVYNLLVADVTGIWLGGDPDYWDCRLLAQGRQAVIEWCRLDVLGLFEPENRWGPKFDQEFKQNRYFRERVHAIVFLMDTSRWGNSLDPRYEGALALNPALLVPETWLHDLGPVVRRGFEGWVEAWLSEPEVVDAARSKLAQMVREAGLTEDDLGDADPAI
ncbi:MAG: hypothetical protein HY320_15050 [Armatimonadetes bacterium]|nr:hypothetical protein [Armatimonadota bacterium]